MINSSCSSLINQTIQLVAVYILRGLPSLAKLLEKDYLERYLMADVFNEWTDGSLTDGYTILYLVQLKVPSSFH